MDLTLYRVQRDDGGAVGGQRLDSAWATSAPRRSASPVCPPGPTTRWSPLTPRASGIANYTLQITPPAATGDDLYEPNSDKARPWTFSRPEQRNSPNLGVLTATKTIQNLVMDDAADWFKFQTQGVGTTANSLTVSFDPNAGDMDLTLYTRRWGDGGAVGSQRRLRRGQRQPRDDQPRFGVLPAGDLLPRGGHPSHRGLRHRQLHPSRSPHPPPPATIPYEPNSDDKAIGRGTSAGRRNERTRRTSGC